MKLFIALGFLAVCLVFMFITRNYSTISGFLLWMGGFATSEGVQYAYKNGLPNTTKEKATV